MENKLDIGIFVAVCERDFHWFEKFERQAKILGYPISVFADHLSPESLERLEFSSATCFVHDNQTEQFSEKSKEIALRFLKDNNFKWAIQMDIDETWQDGAKELIEQALSENQDKDIGECQMITVDNRDGKLFKRVDDYFTKGVESKRERIYNLSNDWRWVDPITCGAKMFRNNILVEQVTQFWCPAASVHWGYSTQELRLDHTDKWHDVWMKTVGRIPYASYGIHSDITYKIPVEPLDKIYYQHLCE
jgi:hypothetical protein